MKYLLSSTLFLFLIFSNANAALYYMSTTGTKTSGVSTQDDWSNANCYASLSTVLPEMAASDELIINDGTYTGVNNQINQSGYYPPDGTSGNNTVVSARNTGQVIFDGENTRYMFLYYGDVGPNPMQYVEFHGLIWRNGSGDYPATVITDSDHVKFFECGFYDSGGDEIGDNEATFSVTRSEYMLIEDCYAWGNGRYKFLSYESDYIVFRRCVVRFDYCYEENEPKASFSAYHSNYVEFQNCISIDGDTRTQWPETTQNNQVDGNFYAPNNSNFSTNVNFRGCIALNTDMPFSSTSGSGTASEGGPVLFENCVGYSVWDGSVTYNANNTDIKHSTFGAFTHPNYGHATTEDSTYGFNFYDAGADAEFDDNIIFNVTGITTSHFVVHGNQLSSLDNNNFYNVIQSDDTVAYSNDTNTITSNPLSTALKYLVKIENGSSLDGQASDAGDVGATITKQIGTSGSLYGESGYATATATDLWPFPNEDVIRTKMAAYSNYSIDGARGFCADIDNPRTTTGKITLTSYIWEYLGNTDATAGLYGVPYGLVIGTYGEPVIIGNSGTPVIIGE